MQQILTYTLLLSALLFSGGEKSSAHPLDLHLPTSYDYLLESEFEKDSANKIAEEKLNDANASEEDVQKALDQLFGPNGNRV